MVDAQEWLDKKYSKEERGLIRELFIQTRQLENSLDLNDFVKLEELNCQNNQIASLNLSACQKLKKVDCSSNQLVKLELGDCLELIELNSSYNKLTSFDISSCPSLEKLEHHNNLLTNLDFLIKLNSEKLTFLSLAGNNFPTQDLKVFSDFKKLKELWLGTDNRENRIKNGTYNRFYGSLKFLQDMWELEGFDIEATDIDSGWEYLPTTNLKKFWCQPIKEDAKVKKIYDLCGGINDSQELAINLKSLQEQWRIKQEEKNKKIQTELSGQEITSLEQELNKKKQEIDYLQQKLREKSELVLSVLESYLIDRKEKLTILLLQVENKLDENGQRILTSLRRVDENNPLLKQITENLCQKQLLSEWTKIQSVKEEIEGIQQMQEEERRGERKLETQIQQIEILPSKFKN